MHVRKHLHHVSAPAELRRTLNFTRISVRHEGDAAKKITDHEKFSKKTLARIPGVAMFTLTNRNELVLRVTQVDRTSQGRSAF